MVTALLVGAGGFIGAVSRYLLSGLVQNASGNGGFPWGTLAVPVSDTLLACGACFLYNEAFNLPGVTLESVCNCWNGRCRQN
jgi:fluoride ion exporter CrcB/FEX